MKVARTLISALALAALTGGVALAQAPSATSLRPLCLWTYTIEGTTVVNPSTILFHTRDGRTYVNTLKAPCPGLMLHGFVYLTHSSEICSNAVPISVIETHQACALGVFEPAPNVKPWSYSP
jgi:hypothetical protein